MDEHAGISQTAFAGIAFFIFVLAGIAFLALGIFILWKRKGRK